MTKAHRPWYRVLYIQVLIAIALGIVIGHFFPKTGVALKPLGDGFIALIKMMIAPIIFCTVVHGIGSMSDLKKVGRVGVKTLFYFEAVSTLALAIGLLIGEILKSSPTASSVRWPAAICSRCCWCRSCRVSPSRGSASSARRSTP